MAEKFTTVDSYVASLPEEARAAVQDLRRTVRDVLPAADETISYNIPTLRIGGLNIVHYSGWKSHTALYPVPEGDAAFQLEIKPWRAGKGTVKFPLGQPLPHELIRKLVLLLDEERSLKG